MKAHCIALAAALITSFRSAVAAPTLGSELVNLSLRAAQLSRAVGQTNPGVTGATIFTDDPDGALFVKEGNVCWAVFRATTGTVVDWLQNVNVSPKNACFSTNQCCSTHGGYRDAYFLPSYRSQLETAVRNCKTNCPSCKVVLAGTSQGAGIAAVASIPLKDLNPMVITFGQPASIIGTCSLINENNHYRYINSIFEGGGDLNYDPVPFAVLNAKQRGHTFLLGDDDKHVAYYANGGGPSVVPTELDVDAHALDYYILRLTALKNRAAYPIGLDGWDIGYACNEDSECITPGRCAGHRCNLGINGDPCHGDDDCNSSRCEGYFTLLVAGTCKAKLSSGSGCDENSDCLSNKCNWKFKCT